MVSGGRFSWPVKGWACKGAVGLTRLIWRNGSARFVWRRIAGIRRWRVTGVGHPGIGNLEL